MLDGSHFKSATSYDVEDSGIYKVGKCILTTIYLEDVSPVRQIRESPLTNVRSGLIWSSLVGTQIRAAHGQGELQTIAAHTEAEAGVLPDGESGSHEGTGM